MKRLFLSLIVGVLLLLEFVFPVRTSASSNNRFVTIVNPIRISSYNKNPIESLKKEYEIVRKLNFPATWLLTYDVLNNKEMIKFFRNMDDKQEIGIFLEVTENFAKSSDVIYNNIGFWHHANSVFLSGYSQEERIKLINTVFQKFKEEFDYYPRSVGAWWIDSFSLSYMQQNYGITANLSCSDQFSTDGYQIWGLPWMIPYYPSKYHAGVPATNKEAKLDLVNIQWAFRDPINGYENSLFSTQDYLMTRKNLDFEYFIKILDTYLFNNNEYGQVTVGLEGDLDPNTYGQEYKRQLEYVKKIYDQGKIKVVTMDQFSKWYRETYKDIAPQMIFKGKDLLNSDSEFNWIVDSKYRLYYLKNKDGGLTVKDLRVYNNLLIEPYYYSPNRSFNLTISIPSIFDGIAFGENIKKFSSEKDLLSWLNKTVNQEENRKIPIDEKIIKGFTLEAIHFFKSKKFPLELLKGKGWEYFRKIKYFISQEELYALRFLSTQQSGKVLVYNNECLQCEYHTEYKPVFFANLRDYVAKFGKKKIVYNKSIFESKDRETSKKELTKLNIKYIYLVKFESYVEKLPFSPGDLGIEKIFENANSVIWRVN